MKIFNLVFTEIDKYKERIAAKKYAREFPYYISREFGSNEKYSADKIETVINKYKFSSENNFYAHSMFLSEEEFNKNFEDVVHIKPYKEYRKSIKNILKIDRSNFGFFELIINSRFRNCVVIHDNNDERSYEILETPDTSGTFSG